MIPPRVAKYQPIWSTIPGQLGLPDPYLVAAIGDRESLWGEALTPPGPAGTGDGGHGRGLMQIDDRAWPQWVALLQDAGIGPSQPLWTDPVENVRQGCRVLRGAWVRLRSWPATIAAYNAGTGRIARAVAVMAPGLSVADQVHCLNLYTTGGDYVSDVLARWAAFKGLAGGYTLSDGGMDAT